MRPLGPPGLLEKVKDLICVFLNLKEIEGKSLPDTPLSPPYTLQHPQDTLRRPQTFPYHPWPIINIAKCSPQHSQTFLTLNRHHWTPSFPLKSSPTSLDNPNASQTVWRVHGSSQGCSWGTGECVWSTWWCFGVSRGVLATLEGVTVLRDVFRGVFYSILMYLPDSELRALIFSSRPGGPGGLIYQNVPRIRSFWPIGKPRERFRSRVIRVYFIAVLLDHTVHHKTGFKLMVTLQSGCVIEILTLCRMKKIFF